MGLYAYDATNLANLLYTSSQAANNRDSPGTAVKFEKPIIANGKVYVATQTAVSVYGLFAALPPAPSPVFSPAPGSYGSAQTVTLSDSASGAAIYYTTNGTTPTTSSGLYSPGTPLYVASTTTVEAIAVASGYSNSAVTSGTYTITSQGTTPISINLSACRYRDGNRHDGICSSAWRLGLRGLCLRRELARHLAQLEWLDLHLRCCRNPRCRERRDHCAARGQ